VSASFPMRDEEVNEVNGHTKPTRSGQHVRRQYYYRVGFRTPCNSFQSFPNLLDTGVCPFRSGGLCMSLSAGVRFHLDSGNEYALFGACRGRGSLQICRNGRQNANDSLSDDYTSSCGRP
jgi:hypothetical protein